MFLSWSFILRHVLLVGLVLGQFGHSLVLRLHAIDLVSSCKSEMTKDLIISFISSSNYESLLRLLRSDFDYKSVYNSCCAKYTKTQIGAITAFPDQEATRLLLNPQCLARWMPTEVASAPVTEEELHFLQALPTNPFESSSFAIDTIRAGILACLFQRALSEYGVQSNFESWLVAQDIYSDFNASHGHLVHILPKGAWKTFGPILVLGLEHALRNDLVSAVFDLSENDTSWPDMLMKAILLASWARRVQGKAALEALRLDENSQHWVNSSHTFNKHLDRMLQTVNHPQIGSRNLTKEDVKFKEATHFVLRFVTELDLQSPSACQPIYSPAQIIDLLRTTHIIPEFFLNILSVFGDDSNMSLFLTEFFDRRPSARAVCQLFEIGPELVSHWTHFSALLTPHLVASSMELKTHLLQQCPTIFDMNHEGLSADPVFTVARYRQFLAKNINLSLTLPYEWHLMVADDKASLLEPILTFFANNPSSQKTSIRTSYFYLDQDISGRSPAPLVPKKKLLATLFQELMEQPLFVMQTGKTPEGLPIIIPSPLAPSFLWKWLAMLLMDAARFRVNLPFQIDAAYWSWLGINTSSDPDSEQLQELFSLAFRGNEAFQQLVCRLPFAKEALEMDLVLRSDAKSSIMTALLINDEYITHFFFGSLKKLESANKLEVRDWQLLQSTFEAIAKAIRKGIEIETADTRLTGRELYTLIHRV
jgi:hypothetical protein